ncbi:MAG: FAD-dependent oxidoreductase, partial [Pseudomonadota bacterium]
HIVLMAAGFRGFELLERHFALELGFGVHGEAAVFQLAPDAANDLDEAPIIYDDGTYVVAHGGGRVAVGSTSARHFTEPNGVAPEMPAFIARAQALCPPLRNAALIERWAGVRPKCVAREPVAGLWPETPGLAVLTGGFKISLGVAHYLAQAAVAGMVGDLNDPALAALPPTWHPLHHLQGHQLPGHHLPAQNA